jgi:3-oxoacyl-[acyl-carrier protein] reductase
MPMSATGELAGRVAIVTGGAVGIGRGIAMSLAEAGADVAISWLSHAAEGNTVVAEIENLGRRAFGFRFDASSPEDVTVGFADVVQALGRLDICVNNAGSLVGRASLPEMPDSHWEKVLRVNLNSTFLCSRAALAYLPDGGRIVNMSSSAAYNGGGAGCVAYATAKAGVIGFTRALAKEVAPKNITVNAVAPGLILDTPFHETFTPAEVKERIIKSIPLGKAGQPADVASAVRWLCGPGANWITGEVVQINGGQHFL